MIGNLLASPLLASAFTDEEISVIRVKLTVLAQSSFASYAANHPQPSAEDKSELFKALLYSLSLDPSAPQTFRPLLVELPEVRLENAQYELRRKAECAARLCSGMLRLFPLPSQSANRTLKSIQSALKNYDPVFFAHRLNADYAYPLTSSMPEKQGIDLALEYLIRFGAELSVIRAFAPHRAAALLDGWRPDWRTADVNLLSPLVGNALALTLLSRDPRRLHISGADREALHALLALKNKEQLERSLLFVFPDTAKALSLDDPDEVVLIMNAAKSLATLVFHACQCGSLDAVFPSFSLPQRETLTSCWTD